MGSSSVCGVERRVCRGRLVVRVVEFVVNGGECGFVCFINYYCECDICWDVCCCGFGVVL